MTIAQRRGSFSMSNNNAWAHAERGNGAATLLCASWVYFDDVEAAFQVSLEVRRRE